MHRGLQARRTIPGSARRQRATVNGSKQGMAHWGVQHRTGKEVGHSAGAECSGKQNRVVCVCIVHRECDVQPCRGKHWGVAKASGWGVHNSCSFSGARKQGWAKDVHGSSLSQEKASGITNVQEGRNKVRRYRKTGRPMAQARQHWNAGCSHQCDG